MLIPWINFNEVNDMNEVFWHGERHMYYKWHLLHAWSNWVLYTPMLWSWLSHESTWEEMHRSVWHLATIIHVGHFIRLDYSSPLHRVFSLYSVMLCITLLSLSLHEDCLLAWTISSTVPCLWLTSFPLS
jgi:hypothetical protein